MATEKEEKVLTPEEKKIAELEKENEFYKNSLEDLSKRYEKLAQLYNLVVNTFVEGK